MPYLWLLIFFLVPFLIVLKISFAEFSPLGRPPYEPVFRWLDEGALQIKLLIGSYQLPVQRAAVRQRLDLFDQGGRRLDGACACCSAIRWPMPSRAPTPTYRNVFLMLIILPFWTSFLLRVYAWIGLLKTDGVINNVLQCAAASSTSRWR